MQECGRLDVAGLAARIILVAECITLVGGGRLDVACGRANPAGGWPSGLGWQSVSYWRQSVSCLWVVVVWTWLVAERIMLRAV